MGEYVKVAKTSEIALGTGKFVEVQGPWHGARFKIPTGEVLGPPAPTGVPQYNLRVQGDDIEVEV